MVLSGILGESLQKILGPVMRRFFHLPACTACTVFMGLIGGYPIGAKMTASLLEQKQIDSKTAVHLLCFCVNAGPSFLITAVGTGLMGNFYAGFLLLCCQWISAILIGLGLGFLNRGRVLVEERKRKKSSLPFSAALVQGVQSGIQGMLSVIGYVLLFSALLNVFYVLRKEKTLGPADCRIAGGDNRLHTHSCQRRSRPDWFFCILFWSLGILSSNILF